MWPYICISTSIEAVKREFMSSFLTNYAFIFFFGSICENSYPCFEISAVNPDKPPLSVTQIKDRVKQFEKVGECDYLSLCCFYCFTSSFFDMY